MTKQNAKDRLVEFLTEEFSQDEDLEDAEARAENCIERLDEEGYFEDYE